LTDALHGSSDTANALGDNNGVQAVFGSSDTAIAIGNGNAAYAWHSNNSTAVAVGGCSITSTGGTFLSCHA